MRRFFAKPALVTYFLLTILVIGLLIYFPTQPEPVEIQVEETPSSRIEIIGRSVEGRMIEAYPYGNGEKNILFVGGIHGGYEWNSVLLAYKLIEYLDANPELIPANVKATVIPVLNPDGLYKVTNKEGIFTTEDILDALPLGTGRFNAHNVDLNRNFDCNWQATSTWRSNIVNAGTAAFSEPEARTLRDYVLKINPVAVVFWHSQANAVYASACNNGILPKTRNILNLYSKSADYRAVDFFESYAITGTAEDWLASINIPAITVELRTHEVLEWEKNLAGVKALFNYFASYQE